MHLAIVTPFPPSITGIGQYGYYVTRALAESGTFERITVLAGSTSDGPRSLEGVDVEYNWRPNDWQARRNILAGLKRAQPDLVWFNVGASIFGRSPWINLSGLLSPYFARRAGLPTVLTLHELVEASDLRALKAPGGFLARFGARFLTKIVTQADVVCLTMSHYADLLRARGIECAHIPIGAYHEPEQLPESGGREILFFSTLAPFKGVEILLEIFPQLRADYPDLHLTIAGAHHTRFPNYASELKARFNDMQGVTWLHQVNENQVKELFGRAQIVAMPYTASTGSSSVLYQAATWGRPIVASNLGEIQMLMQETGLQVECFENRSAEGLARSLRALLDSPEKRARQARQNFMALQRLRPEETCKRYLAAFDRALEIRHSAARLPVSETA